MPRCSKPRWGFRAVGAGVRPAGGGRGHGGQRCSVDDARRELTGRRRGTPRRGASRGPPNHSAHLLPSPPCCGLKDLPDEAPDGTPKKPVRSLDTVIITRRARHAQGIACNVLRLERPAANPSDRTWQLTPAARSRPGESPRPPDAGPGRAVEDPRAADILLADDRRTHHPVLRGPLAGHLPCPRGGAPQSSTAVARPGHPAREVNPPAPRPGTRPPRGSQRSPRRSRRPPRR
jgi:hypothetical protein